MPRFFLPPTAWAGDGLLPEEEARHCSQVLRASVGDTVTVFDGAGRCAEAEIAEIRRDHVRVRVGRTDHTEPLRPQVTLAQAIPKGKNIDWIIQKAVELGVARVQPLMTRHTVVQIDAREAEKKQDKWQRVALEACKQCGQNWLPVVDVPLTYDAWMSRLGECVQGEQRIIASLAAGARPFRDVLRSGEALETVIVLVGPEGDFSAEETQAALDRQFAPITLGEIVLRVETASMFCLSALRYEFAC